MDFFKGIYYGVLNLDSTSIAFAILMLMVVLCMVRAMFTMAITLLFACIFIIGGMGYTPEEIYYQAQSKITDAKNALIKAVSPLLEDELKNAKITTGKDGSFQIYTDNIKIEGKKGESKIRLYYNDEKLDVDIKEFGPQVESLIKDMETNTSSIESSDQ